MTKAELQALAELEDRMADWLFSFSRQSAAIVSRNRASALRALAEEMNDV